MWQNINRFDHFLFLHLNKKWTHPLLDQAMPVITDLHKVWWVLAIVLPVILVFWLIWKRSAIVPVLLVTGFSLLLSDVITYRVLKPAFDRARPEFTSNLSARVLAPTPKGPGFPSNHAANAFSALSTIGFFYPPSRTPLLVLASVIAYSRVYLGVHFPFDVLIGALFGLFCSYLSFRIYKKVRIFYYTRHRTHKLLPNAPWSLERWRQRRGE